MTAADVLRTGALGLRIRRARAALSALGIAIGVASMVAVLGISESSKADLLAQLDDLGTNLLRVAPGQSFLGDDVRPARVGRGDAPPRPGRGVGRRRGRPRRADRAPQPVHRRGRDGRHRRRRGRPGAAATRSARRLRRGRFLDAATGRYPTVVLGAEAAATLGIDDTGSRVWLGDRWFTVIGILDPVALAPNSTPPR